MKVNLVLLVAILLGLSLATRAQTSRGTVTGIVSDPTGAVVAGANATLTNNQTTVSRSTVANNDGVFRFDAVDPGVYTLKITAPNFGEVTKQGVEVQANQVAQADTTLSPAGQSATVNVTSDSAAVLQTEAPVRGGNINPVQITQLPISQSRNPVSLALTLPGVSTNRFGFGVGTFSVNGSRGRSNNFLIDGTENNDISVAGQGFAITNPDAVQEVSVQTSNYDAEFGRAGGAVVNVITKSGGNKFHGSLSFLYDTTADDAISNTQATPDVIQRGKPPYGTDQFYSFTLGGPLYLPRFGEGGKWKSYDGHDRTFFFFAYQQERQASNTLATVISLSPAGRQTLRTLFPAGTNKNVDLYLGLTSGVNATSNFFTQALGSGRPAIEFGDAGVAFAQLYFEPQYQIRIDHKISDRDQLTGRYLFDDQRAPVGGATLGLPGFTTSSANRFQNALISETHIFSPNWTNEARLAYNRIALGFPNDAASPLAQTLPSIVIASITNVSGKTTNLGIQTNLPQGRIANNYVLQDTVTHLRGTHTFRFGLDLLKQRSRQFAPIIERGLLSYQAGGGFTSFANFVDDFGGSGLSTGSADRDFGSPRYYPFLFRQAYFFQDRWRATESLTLTLGLRYENFGQPINTLRTAAFTGLFNVDPVTFTGPFSQPSKVKSDNNNFAPTFGLAWSPSYRGGFLGRLIGEKRTVFRLGYQIGYDSFFNNISSNAATSSPNVVSTLFTSVLSGSSPRGAANLSTLLPTTARPLSALDAQTLVDPNLVNPYYQKWSVGVQRALPFNLVVDAAYVGSKGTKLYLNEDRNPLVPANLRITPATATPIPASRLSGRLDNLQGARTIRSNSGSSTYHAGQVQVTRRFEKGFLLTGAYTYSKLIDNGSEVFASTGLTNSSLAIVPVILGGERLERGLSLFDRTHRASLTYVYELPFFKNQRGALGHLLGGWEISGVTTFESGVPYTVSNGVDSNGVGGNNDRPNVNPNGQPGVRAVPVVDPTSGAITGYVNPDANNAPIDPNTARYIGLPAFNPSQPLSIARTGNAGRNTERSDGINNTNLNLLKRIRIRESMMFEFRTEFFNVFNHPQFGTFNASPFNPGNNPNGSSAAPSSTVFTTAAGRFLRTEFGDGGGRVIRYQIKFTF